MRDRRYDLPAFLSLRSEASRLVHPRHEAMCEIAKWALPIMCRRPGEMTPEGASRESLQIKRTMAEDYLFVLERISPGISKMKAKVQVEYVEAALELAFRDSMKEEDSLAQEELGDKLSEMDEILQRAARGLDLEGNLSPFEGWMRGRIGTLMERCKMFKL